MGTLILYVLQMFGTTPLVDWNCVKVPHTKTYACSRTTTDKDEVISFLKTDDKRLVIKSECSYNVYNLGVYYYGKPGTPNISWNCTDTRMTLTRTSKMVERKSYDWVISEDLVPVDKNGFFPKYDSIQIFTSSTTPVFIGSDTIRGIYTTTSTYIK